MPLIVKDRVQETSTTTGTGTFTLGGAVTGFETFSSSIGNGNTTYYAIVGGAQWEVGLGTVGAGTLARTTVLESSNSDALVDFSAGAKNVFCTYPAEKSIYYDASNNVNIDITGNSATVTNGLYTSNIGISVQAYDADTTKNDVANTFTANQVISVTDNTNAALRITQLGTGNALVVEDSSNPDSTPFVINSSGNVGIGTNNPATKLTIGDITDSNNEAQVNANGTGLASFIVNSNGIQAAKFAINTSGSTDAYGITNNAVGLHTLNSATSLTFGTNATRRMSIASDGSFSAVIPSGSVIYPAFWCRAWVNFNGTGTVAIRGSGNVSSITDNGTGQYTLNFTTAMPDANYSAVGSAGESNTSIGDRQLSTYPINTSSCKVVSGQTASSSVYDAANVHVAIFR